MRHRTLHRLAALSLALAVLEPAAAQGSAVIYGTASAGVTVRDHQAGDGRLVSMDNGVLMASLLGFRVTEDLGGGLSAVVRLELGIGLDSGATGATIAGSSRFYNRQSFAGLNLGPAATVTLGRQFHAATERVIQSLDVYNVSGTTAAVTPLGLFGVNRFVGNDSRADDSVKLRLRGPAGLTGGLSVQLNEERAGRSRSFDLARITPDHTIAAFGYTVEGPTAVAGSGRRPEHTAVGLGGNLRLGPARVYLLAMDARLDATVAGRPEQRHRILVPGVAWSATPSLTLKASWTEDRATDLNGVAGRDGTKRTIVASAEYGLSRRTSLYAAAFTNGFQGGYVLDPVNVAALGRHPSAGRTSGASAGIRHDF